MWIFRLCAQVLLDAGFEGWCTVEQDIDPTLGNTPTRRRKANRAYLASIGFK
jgi:inosose dehydratase